MNRHNRITRIKRLVFFQLGKGGWFVFSFNVKTKPVEVLFHYLPFQDQNNVMSFAMILFAKHYIININYLKLFVIYRIVSFSGGNGSGRPYRAVHRMTPTRKLKRTYTAWWCYTVCSALHYERMWLHNTNIQHNIIWYSVE